jgi:hypothetical protein
LAFSHRWHFGIFSIFAILTILSSFRIFSILGILSFLLLGENAHKLKTLTPGAGELRGGPSDPTADQLLHRVVGRHRRPHRHRLHALLHGLRPGDHPTKNYKYWLTNICTNKYL